NPAIFERAAATLNVDTRSLERAIVETDHGSEAEPGRPSPRNASGVIAAIEYGVRACGRKEAAALVTAPIQKSALTQSGFGFPGHTEYLAHLTGAKQAVMMLASSEVTPPLRVVPFTIHISLSEVFRLLEPSAIADTATIVLGALTSDFGCSKPKLAIAG